MVMSALCQKRTSEPVYSITSSARPSRESGVLRPRAFADLRLIIISSFVAWTTGRSAGFSPLRIRPVPKQVGIVGAIADQTAGRGKLAIRKDRWYTVASCQFAQLLAPTRKECVGTDHDPANLQLDCFRKDPTEVLIFARV